jgi:hypothetical protein
MQIFQLEQQNQLFMHQQHQLLQKQSMMLQSDPNFQLQQHFKQQQHLQQQQQLLQHQQQQKQNMQLLANEQLYLKSMMESKLMNGNFPNFCNKKKFNLKKNIIFKKFYLLFSTTFQIKLQDLILSCKIPLISALISEIHRYSSINITWLRHLKLK